MNEILSLLVRHGETMLFVAVFIEQLGVPIPAAPVLLSAGALAATGELNAAAGMAAAVCGCVLADLLWFHLARVRGEQILTLLRRLPFESGNGLGRARALFSRHGMGAVVAAKFVPGLSTLVPPLAAVLDIPMRRFFVFDSLGSIMYSGGFLALGYLFSEELIEALDQISQLGSLLLGFFFLAMLAYLGYQRLMRKRALKRLPSEPLAEPAGAGRTDS